MTGLERHFRTLGLDPKEAREAAGDAVRDAEIDRHVEWAGNLAGHRKGLIKSNDGRPMLVLTGPSVPAPASGPTPVIFDLIRQAFPDTVQREVFVGWLAGSYRSVLAGVHHPAPMLCLAAGPNRGKSLLAYLVKVVMGGRSANPHNAWTGSLPWNDDLCGAELLLLDDCQGSTDPRSRLALASNFKEAIYAGDVQMRKRNVSALSVRPVWRVMLCCNDTAESLLILPPIGKDMSDKVILLRVEKITPPVDTSDTAGRLKMQSMIAEELQAFVGYLTRHVIPEDFRDSRSGIMAWQHPDLIGAIDSTKTETRLEELLRAAIGCHLWNDLPQTLTASEIEARLINRDSPVRDQVKTLFGTWSQAAGTYLGRLADDGSDLVKPAEPDKKAKVRRFYLPPRFGG